MQKVTAPLHLGYQGIQVNYLHEILLYFIQYNILIPDDETILNSFKEEYDKEYFGASTAAIVRLYISQYSLPNERSPLITDEIATHMNITYSNSILSSDRHIFGRITNTDNKGIPNIDVTAYDKDLRTNQQLGTSQTDGEGFYEIVYTQENFINKERNTADIYIEVLLENDDNVKSEVFYNVGTNLQLNLVIPSKEVDSYVSEYDELKAKILALLPSGQNLDNLVISDIDFLSNELSENPELIRIFILAQEFRLLATFPSITPIPSDVFYGLLRQNMPKLFEPLISSSSALFSSALQLSISTSIIQHYSSSDIERFVTQLLNSTSNYVLGTRNNTVEKAKTYKILKVALADDKIASFLNYYVANRDNADFWSAIPGLTSTEIANLKNVLTNAILSGNNPAMVDFLSKSGTTFIEPKNYVAKPLEDYWITNIATVKNSHSTEFSFPQNIVGANDTEKIQNYALNLKANYDSAFAIDTLIRLVASDTQQATPFPNFRSGMSTFITNNPTFNIISTPSVALKKVSNGFNFNGIGNKDAFIEEIATIQRLCNLTSDYPLMKTMVSNGINSAKKIGKMSLEEFANAIGVPQGTNHGTSNSNITMASAKVIYDNAEKINMVSASLIGELSSYLFEEVDAILSNAMKLSLMPDLETLFGNLDYCACTHCRSVYSPSAYLVDTLELLHKYNLNAFARLQEKRGDIWGLKLSCENANKVLPYIDITNEILEDLLNPTSQTGQYTISSRNTTLNEKQLKAFPEYLTTQFSTSLPQPYGPYKSVLYKSVYPWTLPFDYYKEQDVEFLKLVDLNISEATNAFLPTTSTESFDLIASAYKYLGLSDAEFRIITSQSVNIDIVGNNTPIAATLSDFWGVYHDAVVGSSTNGKITNPLKGASQPLLISITTPLASANTQTQFNLVNIFLQQSRLTFNDLLELLDCYFINQVVPPATPTVQRRLTIENITGSNPVTDCCNTDKLWIKGLTDDDLAKIHQFVRLKNKLGITFYELDRLIITVNIELGIIPNTLDLTTFIPNTLYNPSAIFPLINGEVIKRIAQIVKISKYLNTTIDTVLCFYDSVQYNQYSSYSGDNPVLIPTQFEVLFRNKAVTDINANDYPFKTGNPFSADFPISSTSSTLIGSDLDIVLSAFGISKNDYQYLIGYFKASTLGLQNVFSITGTDLNFNLKNITHLYREVFLSKLLGIHIKDWCQYRQWMMGATLGTTFSPFEDSFKTLQFFDRLRIIRNSGLDVKDINYIFYNKFESVEEETEVKDGILSTIQELRDRLYAISTYQPELDSDGEILIKRLEYVTTNSQARKVVNILKTLPTLLPSTYVFDVLDLNTPPDSFSHFIYNAILNPFVTPLEIEQIILGNPVTIPAYEARIVQPITLLNLTDRLQYFFNIAIKPILKAQARDFVANKFNLDLSTCETLLETLIEVNSESGYAICANDQFINSPDDIPQLITLPTPIQNVFDVFSRMDKLVPLIKNYQLNGNDIKLFSENRTALHINIDIANLVTPTGIITDNWLQFIDWIYVRAEFDRSNKSIVSILDQALPQSPLPAPTPQVLKEGWFDNIMLAFGISKNDLEVLVGARSNPTAPLTTTSNVIDTSFVTSSAITYPTPALFTTKCYWKLLESFRLQTILETSMVECNLIAQQIILPTNVTVSTSPQDDVDVLINLMKSKYSDDEWLSILKPINDRLRVKRRDAMVAYLLGNPCFGFKGIWRTSNDLYEQLLIDIEMMPCMLTSRTRQAISTVQLFIDRCLLTLEVYNNVNVLLTPETARQWNLWRKFYRVWEANRKVFLYPENWIEPDLRDNKSPFFVDLEKFLKQNEITKENVEEAYKTYLERLDEVSHLDPVGIYAEESTGVVNAWGRTKAHPHIYYHRVKSENEWSPWVKMDVQIDGDHFVPVMWKGRLRLYWLVFTEQTVDSKPAKLSLTEEMEQPERYWKIELAWSEFKNKRWQPKQLGKEAHKSSRLAIWNEGAIQWNAQHPQVIGSSGYWWGMVTLNTPDTIKACMQYLRDDLTFYCKKNEDGDLEFVLTENIKCVTPEMVFNQLTQSIVDAQWNSSWINAVNNLFDANANDNNPYFLTGHIGKFTIKHNGVFADSLQWGEYWYNTNYYHEYLSGFQYNIGYLNYQTGYEYRKDVSLGYTHDPDENYWKLLNKAPGYAPRPKKYVHFQRQIPVTQIDQSSKINFHKFFYRDYRNSFYVERTKDKVKYASNSLGAQSLGAVNITLSAGFQSFNDPVFAASPGGFQAASGTLADSSLFIDYPSQYYRFFPFYHYTVNEMSNQLFQNGIDGLLDFDFVKQQSEINSTEVIHFSTEYLPTMYVDSRYPKSYIDYSIDGAYSLYNWELFFHIPMLIANRLMQNQKFFEAREWYHYVFNPTNTRLSAVALGSSDKFWNFIPFYHHAIDGIPTIYQIMSGSLSPDTQKAIDKWAQNPFKPHLVARTRIGAYMRNIVMKYLDNLIAWGDQLFRRDTMESINEATLMYILAAQILGRRPYKIPERVVTSPKTYSELLIAGLNAFSNAQVAVESILMPTAVTQTISGMSMDYFCIPPNEKLLAYWDIVGDRLFKIRHCQNIDGVERSLALFEPPIDPALLVKATSMGVSISDAVNDVLSPLPQYRFNVMVQKAMELAQEVKSMGASLLAAIEKKDAEQISLLRSSHELSMLEVVKELKELQNQESTIQVEILKEQRKISQFRKDYYNDLIEKGLNQHEELQLDSLKLSIPLKFGQSFISSLGVILAAIPNVKIGAPTGMGITYGGDNLAQVQSAMSNVVSISASINDIIGSMAGIKGSFARRKEEWALQNKLAEKELIQIDKQIVAAEIRKSISDKELSNHKLQMSQSLEMDEVMHTKFTNEELYDWMIGEISLTYFQTYNLAVDVAKRAERCYNYDLGTEKETSFISFGYWDSLRKGLLAGDNLLFDIKRMDIAYLEQNKRQHELTKHIPLSSFNPEGLMQFKKNKKLDELEFPEWLFDMDYPGHYFRRIKSISISIPCIAGPYTSVSCKLTLNHSRYRTSPVILGAGYTDDLNYKKVFSGGESIATSNAQNDSGMFELNFRDERYLPFEGAGVISNWKLEIPSKYAQFDINTISDVIFHIKYTARFDGGLTNTANNYLQTQIIEAASLGYLSRIFSLKNEFANEWNKYLSDLVSNPSATLDIKLNHEMFPYFCSQYNQATTPTIFKINLLKAVGQLIPIEGLGTSFDLDIDSPSFEQGGTAPEKLALDSNGIVDSAIFDLDGSNNPTQIITIGSDKTISLTLSNTGNLGKIRDIQFAVIYKLS